MKTKKSHFQKKWQSKPTKNFLSFLFTGCSNAAFERKLRRSCKRQNIILCFLPSNFRINSLFYAQGPSIASIVAKNICFSSYKALTKTTSTALFKENRAFPSSFLENFQHTEKPQDFCANFLEILFFNQNLEKEEV
jgi:hypothetical protein